MPPAGLKLGQLLYQNLDIGSVDIYEFLKETQPLLTLHGRTSRLLLNLELMKDGFPPIVIKFENRLDYYEALDKARTKKIS